MWRIGIGGSKKKLNLQPKLGVFSKVKKNQNYVTNIFYEN
jgi:hypothetical protein